MKLHFLGAALAASMPFTALAQDSDIGLAGEPAPIARLTGKLAYNSEFGPIAGFGVATDRLFDRDQSLSLEAEFQEDGGRYNLAYRSDALFGQSPSFGLRILHSDQNASEVYGFDSRITRIEPRLTWQPNDNLTAATFLSLARNEIDNVGDDASRLIRKDEGRQDYWALGLDLDYRFPVSRGGNLKSARLSFSSAIGATSRDHEFTRFTLRASTIHAFANNRIVLGNSLRLGALEARSGASSIGDRFMLGSGSVRGFAFGGFGPRDLAVPGDPPLGGNYYAVNRTDMRFPNALDGLSERLTPGLFVDLGSLWGLDDVRGGVDGNDKVDDKAYLRSAVGATLRIDTGFGPLRLFVARAVERESYDETQSFGISFSRSF